MSAVLVFSSVSPPMCSHIKARVPCPPPRPTRTILAHSWWPLLECVVSLGAFCCVAETQTLTSNWAHANQLPRCLQARVCDCDWAQCGSRAPVASVVCSPPSLPPASRRTFVAGLRYGECRRRHRGVSLEAYQRLRRRASASFHGEDEEGLIDGEGEGDGAGHFPTDSGGGGAGGLADGVDGVAGSCWHEYVSVCAPLDESPVSCLLSPVSSFLHACVPVCLCECVPSVPV